MRSETLALLRCPYCASPLAPSQRQPAQGPEIESAVLSCDCGEFPLLGGIPIFKREGRVDMMMQTIDVPLIRGPSVRRLLDMIRSGRAEDALMLLLVTPPAWIRSALDALNALPERRQGRSRRLLERAWLSRGRVQRPLFRSSEPLTTARDALDYYYRRSRKSELYNHFFHRFGQPRHLSSLALASLLPIDGRPVLDVACGFGHTLHYWTSKHPGGSFLGLDRNFFELYVARRWVAPRAEYICASADETLPLPDGVLSGVFCADAFHYFLRKVQSVEQFRRVLAEPGLLILTRFGNGLLEPREGYELTPEGYERLLAGTDLRFLADGGLLDRYLSGHGPALGKAPSREALRGEKWLSLVASRSRDVFRDHGPMEDWPHGVGTLRINPLYREAGRAADGGVSLELALPSKWFAVENAECRKYMPNRIDVGREALGDLSAQKRSPAIAELVRQCVVLGLPEAYC